MSRYERVAAHDDDDHASSQPAAAIPTSPPPSFRSQPSSRRPSRENIRRSQEERDLDDAFEAPSEDEEDEQVENRRRLIPENTEGAVSQSGSEQSAAAPYAPASSSGRTIGNSQANDGVFANLAAKPRAGDDLEEKPPTYEQAAADATPPYWETTVLSPYHMTGNPDDVFVDGLLVGSMFSFVWNAIISMSFQLIGFLLTYLLHTTHAAKHGSRAGLGITLIQYGFQMRYSASVAPAEPGAPGSPTDGVPEDPNSHDFDPGAVGGGNKSAFSGMTAADWLSYALMIAGWFLLIRSVSSYMRARRQEALIRSSPDRGLGVAVVAEGESPESSV